MAKYTYQYACGHGTGVVSLFGKNAERERKLAWYADNMVCPDCYKAQQQAAESKAEKVAVVKYYAASIPLFSVVVYGQTFENKEKLKELGFVFADDYEEGIKGLFSISKPKKAWQRMFQAKNETELFENIEKIVADVAELGYVFKNNSINLLDMGLLQTQWAKIAEHKANKPAYNGCFEFMKDRHGEDYHQKWNGKIYGHSGQYNYYIDNKKYNMTDEQKAAIETYRAAFAKWQETFTS